MRSAHTAPLHNRRRIRLIPPRPRSRARDGLAAGAPAAKPGLPDEILEDIFIRLDSAADLARANAACTTFHRVVTARRFLRRYRSLHSPPVLGGIVAEIGIFHPAEPPHRSASAAGAVARAADFTFSLLPKPNRWRTRDVRDGRVLLSAPAPAPASSLEDLVVCDPLHRRHVLIPSIPGDQVASARYFDYDKQEFEPFLSPASEEEKESSSNRAMCNVLSNNKVVTFVFSSVTGQWQRVAETSGFGSINPELFVRHCVRRCSTGRIHTRTSCSPWCSGMLHAIVEFEEGKVGFLALDIGTLELYLRDDGVDADEWRHGKTIPLPQYGCLWYILGATENI
uniref:F-box domain-containing protein n=1 Tax=Setaria viridis TaxID=4556 RepID=A0A4U6VIQ6_SETVI|nr:hypothetical protein SEVIR_3G401600v2 [Setaria viridis]